MSDNAKANVAVGVFLVVGVPLGWVFTIGLIHSAFNILVTLWHTIA